DRLTAFRIFKDANFKAKKEIGIKQQRGLKKMSKKKKINLAISIAQVVVQALILYNTYQQYKYSKKY
ncbi:hypothetical protein V018_02749, partial [Staphylococcus aureus C1891]|uniref:hypothetical protein n=1 Tax=Staphylococcus aureus TaxID=1280 RepID=UPI00044695C2